MTEVLELAVAGIDKKEKHNKSTCPWEQEKPKKGGKLKKAEKEEDGAGEMQENDAGALASAIGGKPSPYEIKVAYEQDDKNSVVVNPGAPKDDQKKVAVYEKGNDEYKVSFAAHHLVPGNEALRGHPIVAWMGDEASIDEAKRDGQPASLIVDGEFIGYDINAKENGIWLPGPYPLSTKGKWPAGDAMDACVRAGTMTAQQRSTNMSFKKRYAFAAIDAAPDALEGKDNDYYGYQFHFRHVDYSEFVKRALTKIETKIGQLGDKCPVAENQTDPTKFNAPAGLKDRLYLVSTNLRPYLKGKPWSKFLYTDELSKDYIVDKKLG